MSLIIRLPNKGKTGDKTTGALWYDVDGEFVIYDKVKNLKLMVPETAYENIEIDNLPFPVDKVTGKQELPKITFDLCLAENETLETLYGAVRNGESIYFKPSIGASQRNLAKRSFFVPYENGEPILDAKDWTEIFLLGPLVANWEHTYAIGEQRAYKISGWSYPDPTKSNACISIGVEAPPAPVAGFSGTPLTGTAPLTVKFTDASTNTPYEFEWKVDSTIFSTKKNPTYIFTAAGTYDITLKVTNSAGNDTETKTDYITVT